MARKLIEYKIADTDTVSYSNYNPNKTVLGPMMYKTTGSSVNDYYMGPPSLAWDNISQDTGLSGFGLPFAMRYTDNIDIIFTNSWSVAGGTYRVAAYSFNKETSVYTYLGMINANTHNTSSSNWGSPVASINYYTAGTVSVTGFSVSGTSTNWGDNQINAGNRIGFGSTNPTEITTWYEIGNVPLETVRFNNTVTALEVDSQGRIYAGGTFTTYPYLGTTHLATRLIRLNSNGTPDLTFNTGSLTLGNGGLNSFPRRIKIDPFNSSKVWVSGDFTTYSGITTGSLIKLNVSDGSLDSQWDPRNIAGTSTGFNSSVYDFDFDSQGRIYATGIFTSYVRSGTTTTVNRLCRLLPNGTLDTTFSGTTLGLSWASTPGNTAGYSLAVDPITDKPYVGGLFNIWGGTTFISTASPYNIIRLNINGTIDTTYTASTQFSNYPHTIVPDEFGSGIYVGGQFTTYSAQTNQYIIKINTGGTKDTSFVNNSVLGAINGTVVKIKQTNDNKLFVAGAFTLNRGTTNVSLMKLNPDGTIDTTFSPETNTTGLQYLNSQGLFLGDSVAVDSTSGDVYAAQCSTYSTNFFGGMVAYTSGGTIDENFYGKNIQGLTLTTSATTFFSAGTPYVIEDLRILFSRPQGNPGIGGLYQIKGIKLTDFVTGTTTINATTSGYYGLQARSCYWMPSSVNTNSFASIYSLTTEPIIDWNSRYCYTMNYNALSIQLWDFRKRFRISSTSTIVYPDSYLYNISTSDGGLNVWANPVIATTQSGSAAGVKSFYYARPTLIRSIPFDNLRSNGIDPYTLAGNQLMNELPPGNTTTYPISNSMLIMNYMPEIDKFLISCMATPFKVYITSFSSLLNAPTLTSTLWSRDTYNTLSYQNSFDRALLVDGRQLQGTLSDTRVPKYPDAQNFGFHITSNEGWTHFVRPLASTENIIYAVPIGADEQYVSTSNNVIITPK
jgi:uncharacterized delta-60 repeat protein